MNFVCGAFWVVSPSHSDPRDWSISTHLALKQWLSGVQCDPTPLHESVGSVCRALCCHKWRKEDALGSLCLESGMQPNTVNAQCEEFPREGSQYWGEKLHWTLTLRLGRFWEQPDVTTKNQAPLWQETPPSYHFDCMWFIESNFQINNLGLF